MANDRIHMNTHGGSALQQATAPKGSTQIGNQPIQEELCTTLGDWTPLASLTKDVTLPRAGVLHRQLEARLNSCEQNCEPVRYGKSGRG
jgi:hypothetical protein